MVLIEEAKIKEGVTNAFWMILFESRDWKPTISGLAFASLPSIDSHALEIPFCSIKLERG